MTSQQIVSNLNKMNLTDTQKWVQVFFSLPERDLQWQLTVYWSGDHNRKKRQEIMSELKGVKVPIAKSGITAIQNTIMESELWQLGEKLRAIGMEDCQDYTVKTTNEGIWWMMRFFWIHPEKGFYPHFKHPINSFFKHQVDTLFILTNKDNITFKDRNNNIHNF